MLYIILDSKPSDTSSLSEQSTISTLNMERIVDQLKQGRVRNTTKKLYHTVWKNFNEFFIKLDRKPETWEDRLVLFVGYLADKRRCSQTIRSYISAIKNILADDGIKLSTDKFLLTAITKACKLRNDQVRTRLPIQKGLLNIILKYVKNFYEDSGQLYLASLYQALFASAYYGLLRVGELTTGTHPIRARDIQIAENKQKILFILRSSKTHGKYAKPQFIKITSQPVGNKKTIFCPYEMLVNYIKIRPKYLNQDEAFFVFRDRSPVRPNNMLSILREILKLAGFEASLYTVHSMRHGRSLDLYNFGIQIPTLMKIGRWSSNTVYTYLAFDH